jgi:hypothetical protein
VHGDDRATDERLRGGVDLHRLLHDRAQRAQEQSCLRVIEVHGDGLGAVGASAGASCRAVGSALHASGEAMASAAASARSGAVYVTSMRR